MRQAAATTTITRIICFSFLLLGTLFMLASPIMADQVAREQDIVNLRLGQRIKVDDGTGPAGQIKQVSGARMVAAGVVHTRKCVPRLGPKIK